jgi:hypothetical protein
MSSKINIEYLWYSLVGVPFPGNCNMEESLRDSLWEGFYGAKYKDVKDSEEEKEEVIKKCIKGAYKDAARPLSGIGSFNNRDVLVSCIKESVSKSIHDLLGRATNWDKKSIDIVSAFNDWHKGACKNIEKCFKEYNFEIKDKKNSCSSPVEYGVFQKLINMSLKNMLAAGLWAELDNIKQCFHVPVDSIIIEAVLEFESVKLPATTKRFNSDGNRIKYSEEKVKSWSKWDEPEYNEFQNTLVEWIKAKYKDKTPIDWENEEWIKTANKIKRNKKEKTKNNK